MDEKFHTPQSFPKWQNSASWKMNGDNTEGEITNFLGKST